MHRVVRPFPVSWDGLTLVDLHAGDERDFGDMTAGLLAEGYIEPVEAAAPVAGVTAAEPVVMRETAAEPVAVSHAHEQKRPYKKRK